MSFISASSYSANLSGYKKYLLDNHGIVYLLGNIYPMVLTFREFKLIERRSLSEIKEDNISDLTSRICRLFEVYKNETDIVIKKHHAKRLTHINQLLWSIQTK